MLKRKQHFTVDLDDEKITREHYIVGKINPQGGQKNHKELAFKEV